MISTYTSPTKLLNEGIAEVLGGYAAADSEKSGNIEKTVDGCIDRFGLDCTRGVVQRAGRAGLYYWLREHAEPNGWLQPEFRLLSFHRKISRGIRDIIGSFSGSHDGSFQVEEYKDKFVIRYRNPKPVSRMDCSFFMGLFQEYLSWIAGGKFFPVTEVECPEDPEGSHILEISTTPLD